MTRWATSSRGALVLAAVCLLVGSFISRSSAQSTNAPVVTTAETATLTNLAQLTHALEASERLSAGIRLEGIVCASSRPELGVVVLSDASGVELLELGRQAEAIPCGERIRIEGERVLLRRRELGVQISPAPTLDNDGLHLRRTQSGSVALKAGRVPFELHWFNYIHKFALEVSCQPPNGRMQRMRASAFWRAADGPLSRPDDTVPGLRAQCYEGFWGVLPDFDLLKPVRTGTTTNVDLSFCLRDELVGLRFTGFFDAPVDGNYTFRVASDDGAMLWVGSPGLTLTRLGASPAPAPQTGWIGQPMSGVENLRWLSVRGRVSFLSRAGEGLQLELRSGEDTLSVTVADAFGLDPNTLINSYVRAVGVGRPALSASKQLILDRLSVASGGDLQNVESAGESPGALLPLVAISHIQAMGVGEAGLGLPVRVRGVVTAASSPDRWFSLQDDSRGIFVDYRALSNSIPTEGELWEVVGRTAPGNFAPIVVAENLERLGRAKLPEAARPSWNELANGSMDQQRVEIRGVVSGARSNQITLLMPEGSLEIQMENYLEADLKQYANAVVRIRGTLFAGWDASTREVQFGNIRMRNIALSVDAPPPADPFDAPQKSARDLLRFDIQTTAYSRIKVRAQALYADAHNIFAMDQGAGIRIETVNKLSLEPGDWFDAVGYPEISGPSPLLRHAVVRKSGSGVLPEPQHLAGLNSSRQGLDSTFVTVEANLIGMHMEHGTVVLEMQSNGQLFVARIKPGVTEKLSLRPGSRLELAGVYLQAGNQRRSPSQTEAFEMLLNSTADIQVLSQPSWWTLKRLAMVVGLLFLGLLLAAVWITQLRRQVEQRTNQLRQEIRQREYAERQHAIEAERSRIARDLHDDLGSGLSEINLLVGTHQRRSGEDLNDAPLFRTIAAKTRRLIFALDVIVWAVDPEDNSLQSLADYLNGFVAEFLAHSGLSCRLKVPMLLPAVKLDGQVRHAVLMTVKEALNNIVRHAHATEVEFRLAADDALTITITDNGKGFDVAADHTRHGLKNLNSRLSALGGVCRLISTPVQGTTVEIRLPLKLAAAEQGLAANVAEPGAETVE